MFGLFYLYGSFLYKNSTKEDLSKHHDKNTKQFNLNGKILYGRVVSIIDGDTIKVVIHIFKEYYKFTIRLNNIDTCEKTSDNSEVKELSLKAKNRLYELITYKTNYDNIYDELNTNTYGIWLKCTKNDKYGRILADIFINKEDTISLNQILINEKLAYNYKGGKKLSETEQLSLLNNMD